MDIKKTIAIIAIISLLGTILPAFESEAGSYSFSQTSWAGGQSSNIIRHGYGDYLTEYGGKDANLDVSAGTEIDLSTTPGTVTQTTTADFNLGATSSTAVSNNSVILSLANSGTANFSYTGAQQTWVVPDGVTSIQVDVKGAQGGTYSYNIGGNGARVQTTLTVTPGQTLYIYVGGQGIISVTGGWNGGGGGGTIYSGGGGGASDIRTVGGAWNLLASLNSRIVVAGGGGGGGYSGVSGGGSGGYPDGGNGGRVDFGGGYGGTQSAGGAGGNAAGGLGYGGAGNGGGGGGGGGSGLYGGGGAGPSNGGGGGGSSYSSGASTTYTTGYQSGNGYVTISYFAYYSSGTFTSGPMNLGPPASIGNFTYTTSGQTAATSIAFKAKSYAAAQTPDFTGCATLATANSGTPSASVSLSGYACVNPTDSYIYYQATFNTSDTTVTPSMDEIQVSYNYYPSQTLTSLVYNSRTSKNTLTGISWTQVNPLPSGTSVKFQIQSSPDNSAWSAWMGPDGTNGTYFYYTSSGDKGANCSASAGSATCTILAGNPLRGGGNDQYFRYKAFLNSTGADTPTLYDATITYEFGTFPFVQTNWGTGASSDDAVHPVKNTSPNDWRKYSAKDANTAVNGSVTLTTAAGTPVVQTNDGTTNTGFTKTGYSNSQTQVAGIGDPASVTLALNPQSYTITQTDNTSTVAAVGQQGGWAYGTFSSTKQNGVTSPPEGASVMLIYPWLSGPCFTSQGIYVYYQDVSGTKAWSASSGDCIPPQCSKVGYSDDFVTDNNVSFGSSYPAREACKVLGGWMPNSSQLQCIYDNKSSYGSFQANEYYTSTETGSATACYINMGTGSSSCFGTKTYGGRNVRCVRDSSTGYNSPGTYTAYVDSTSAVSRTWNYFNFTKSTSAGGTGTTQIRMQVKSSDSSATPPTFDATGNCDVTVTTDGTTSNYDISACAGTGRYLWHKSTLTASADTTRTPLFDQFQANVTNNNYYSFGTYTSGYYDTGQPNYSWGTFSLDETKPSGTNIAMKFRSCANSNCSDRSTWTGCDVTNGQNLNGAACVSTGHQYYQWQAYLTSPSPYTATPSLNSVTTNYNYYPSNQTLTSSAVNSTSAGNYIDALRWNETLPSNTSVTVSLKTADSKANLSGASWNDYTKDSSGCSKSGTTVTCPVAALADAVKDGSNDQWMQYKATLATTDGLATPTLSDAAISYHSSALHSISARIQAGLLKFIGTIRIK